jgi:hypothetical protein
MYTRSHTVHASLLVLHAEHALKPSSSSLEPHQDAQEEQDDKRHSLICSESTG